MLSPILQSFCDIFDRIVTGIYFSEAHSHFGSVTNNLAGISKIFASARAKNKF